MWDRPSTAVDAPRPRAAPVMLPVDERIAAGTTATMAGIVAALERAIRGRAERIAADANADALADAFAFEAPHAFAQLARSGVLDAPELLAECDARVALELLGNALPDAIGAEADAPSLLVRLTRSSDRDVAAAAAAVMAADSARRSAAEARGAAPSGLGRALLEPLAFAVAAAVRGRLPADPVADGFLVQATLAVIEADTAAGRLEALAMALAAAIDARAEELPALLEETLADRRLVAFTAFAATAAAVPYEAARAALIDPAGDAAVTMLRAAGLPRAFVGRVAMMFCFADSSRDVDAVADAVDRATALSVGAASTAIGDMRLDPRYLAARRALGAGR